LILLDTHVLAWALLTPERLSQAATGGLVTSSKRMVSAASLYEMSFKAGLGKWHEIEAFVKNDIPTELEVLEIDVLPATGEIMQLAGGFDWAHRDPFDRLIVATAISHGIDLISADGTLDSCPERGWKRVW